VLDVRSLSVAAVLAALFVVSQTSIGLAASVTHSTRVAYSSANANMSRAEEPVPANCIRQSCGKLWCWQMNGSRTSGR
jgi:hypothetical protein